MVDFGFKLFYLICCKLLRPKLAMAEIASDPYWQWGLGKIIELELLKFQIEY